MPAAHLSSVRVGSRFISQTPTFLWGTQKLKHERDKSPLQPPPGTHETDENMAANKTECVRVPTLMTSLSMDILEKLGMKLNPRHPLKDFRYLAGKMSYTYERVRNLEYQKNPTVALLGEWMMSSADRGEARTVTDLIELLKDMKRDDAVDLLRPVEFTGKCYGSVDL